MEQNQRTRSSAAEPVRRPVQYGRATLTPVQPQVEAAHIAPQPSVSAPASKQVSFDLHFGLPKFRRVRALLSRLFPERIWRSIRKVFARTPVRIMVLVFVLTTLASQLYPLIEQQLIHHVYDLGSAESLLPKKDKLLTEKLKYNAQKQTFEFNAGYDAAAAASSASGGGPKISASLHEDAKLGLSVTDPINKVDFTIKPKYGLHNGRQDGNRVVYPLNDGTGWLVYTMEASQVKEDVILSHANGDKMTLDYDLDLGDNFVARKLSDGSIGVYGSDSVFTSNVSTGSDKDAKLLAAARKKAPKTKLYFTLPTPVVYEANKTVSKVNVAYELKGNSLKTVVTGLDQGKYPLTVDPAVTVTSTSSLFRDTTPESNVDFNSTTGNISRGAVTGGVLGSWTTNANNLATPRFAQSATIYDDYIYVAGGIPQGGSTTPTTSIEFSQLNSANPSIGSWSSTTSLPIGLARFQLLAYNGYLYAIGGTSADNLCNTTLNSVYYIRIQANGQLSGSWTTSTSTLPTAVCSLGAIAYNGKIYVAGGQTGKQYNTAVTTTAYATINPDGSVGTFTTSAVALPVAVAGADLRVYNNYLYILGGATGGGGGGTVNTVYYTAIASDGSINGTSSANWLTTSAFTNARANLGSSFTFAYDGFMYMVGGCQTFNASFNCSVPLQDVQISQFNADGSLGAWSTNTEAQLASTVVGESIISWRGNVYNIAGCTTTASNVTCTAALGTQQYNAISSAGQVGPLKTATNLPASLYQHGAVINNGFLYVVGGCITNSCQTGTSDTTGNVSYVALNSDGSIGGAWTTDATNRLNGATGLASFGLTVYNNTLYATGGYSNSGTGATGSTATATIFYVKLNTNGSLTGAWTSSTGAAGLSVARYANSAVAHRGYLIVMGGCTNAGGGAGCSSYSAVVEIFTINQSTGALSARTAQTSLPVAKSLMGVALYNGRVYLAGGSTAANAQTNNIYYASISSTGSITSWSTASGTLSHNLRRVDAYVMNGYLYVFGGHDGGTNTTYDTIQIGKITMSSGNITSNLTDSSTTITARWDARAAYANGYLYVTGGCTAGNPPNTCSARSNLTEYVENYNAGNKNTSTWTNMANGYSQNRVAPATAAYNGYLYIAGGCKTAFTVTNFSGGCASGNEDNTVYYSAIAADGAVGAWATNAAYNLPAARAGGCMVTAGGYLYYVGGQGTGTAQSTVYYSQLGSNGVPGAWSTATNALPAARSWMGCDVFNNFIYVTGGLDNAGTPAVQSSVYHSPSLSAGGNIGSAWTTDTSFTTARENHSTISAGGYLYVMGGDDKTTARLDVQYIQISPSTGNTTGSWAYASDLPQPISNQASFAANGYIYLIGGRTAASTCVSTTVVASINSTGTLSSWSGSVNNLTSARFGAGAAFYNGYYYAMGGHSCSAILTGVSSVMQGGQRSPAMKGSFSKYADLNGNGQPEKLVIYLTNAQNNGVDIEQWKMTYVSSRDGASPTYGTVTTVSPLVHENAYSVTALDGSGVNQLVARWFWLTFSINMEQTFTFTDDAQPTIYQYGLHYAPPPSKRLMHGRDFRDQNQQGLDLKLGI